ncbi:unnamed protein product, partial [Ilex paraguariensis]
VEELLRRKAVKEVADKEFQEFVELLKSAKATPLDAKPPKSSWKVEEKSWLKIESIEAYAVDACRNDDQKKTAGVFHTPLMGTKLCVLYREICVASKVFPQILKAMGLPKTASSAVNLLIDIGYFPVHVNLDLLKFNIRTDYPDEILSAAEHLVSESSDPDEASPFP